MILLGDVLDYVNTLGISEIQNNYCGVMSDKKQKAIGVYPLKSGRAPRGTLGGSDNSSYEIKGISFLIHWNKSPSETETAAIKLHKALSECRNITINGHEIMFIQLSYGEPIPVGTDDNGIFEYVVECLFYFRKES